jgi:hypothetical protein
MIRSVFATLAALVIISATGAQGCAASGVGDPCIPEQEYDQAFLGFDPEEVNVESKSFQCLTRLCLVNHFRGRVTCPYGQDKMGMNLPGTDGASGGPFPSMDSQGNPVAACLIPGGTDPTTDAITGKDSTGTVVDPVDIAQVNPGCIDRQSANTVYCSCRCANANGQTNDGAVYCTCPDGYDCSQLINPIASIDPDLTGAYCVKKATEYQSFNSCQLPCDPTVAAQNCDPPSIR